MNTDQNFSVLSTSSEQSWELGRTIAKRLRLGDVVEFVGDLGGGKTTMIKGLAEGLGVKETVTSPTYNIQRSYRLPRGGSLEHYDLYRLGDDEILLQEMRELIAEANSIICVEWADHFTHHLSPDRLRIRIGYIDESKRQVELQGTGPDALARLREVIEAFQEGVAK